MRILFFGSSEFAIPTLDSIYHDKHEIVGVVTQPDRVRGRGKAPSPTPLKAAALEYGLEVVSPPDVNAPDVVANLLGRGAELAYVASFGQKLGRELLESFPMGMVNLHGSLLPALRGAGPVQWAVIRGVEETGVTLFRIVEEMDAGPILVQRRTGIGVDETASELHDRLARIGCDAVRAMIAMLGRNPTEPGTPQDASQVTYAPKLSKADGRIDLTMPVKQLAHRICGLWSWPGASCRFVSADGKRDEVVTLARARPYEGPPRPADGREAIGRVTEVLSMQGADGELSILEIQPAGGRVMDWPDFVNGRHVQPGDRFVSIESAS